ncbi:UDP-N-acetylglucosamine transferase subunit ALG14 homolog isoform X2 [Gigantopelta aegis]|nr:UDP-N-acetylglucosamine transferase subunit ALG14 homolog isoform X2 [Gigantopelta aegis]XP_041359888.1 UDP-N-acetylglucosamine transferase subunit ALG14 homolog isoform X2 [Gigantopelta aegis]
MLCLVDKIGSKYSPRYYIIADTDQISEQKVHALEQQYKTRNGTETEYSIHKVPRSREVSQSWITTIMSTIYAVLYSFPIVFQLKPDLILCNGPGTCIPVCFAGLILKWIHIKQTLIIYIESICRVESLSMSAKILYYLADHMLVQWPQLRNRYPKCQYIGRVV